MVEFFLLVVIIFATFVGAKNKNIKIAPYILSVFFGVIIGLLLHKQFATYFNAKTGLDYPFGSTAAFILLLMLGAILFYALLITFYHIDEKSAEKIYRFFGHANIVLVPVATGTLFVLLCLLVSELPVKGIDPLQKQIGDSSVTKYSKKLIQGSGIDLRFVDTASLSKQQTSETIVPLAIKTSTITFDQKIEYDMLDKINAQRKNEGLEPLNYDNALSNVARDHSIDMMNKRYFAHISLSGKTPFDRLHDAKISYDLAGENLAVSDSVDKAITALMESPTHRANILNKDFHKAGIGIAINQDGVLVISQEFTN